MTSLDGINGWSIQTLLRGENDSKQSDEIQATWTTFATREFREFRDTKESEIKVTQTISVANITWGEN